MTKTKTKVKIPSVEKICLTVRNDDDETYFITQNRVTKKFTLYQIDSGEAKKIGTSNSPKKLEEKYVFKEDG